MIDTVTCFESFTNTVHLNTYTVNSPFWAKIQELI